MSEIGVIRDTLSLLFSDGDVVELRALGDGGVHSGYFSDFDVLADRARAMDAFRDVSGVYVTLNEVNPALLSRRANRVKHHLSRQDATTADADIVRRRWFPIDFDPVRPSGVSSNGEEHAAALVRAKDVAAWLTERGFPVPVLADSGNGAHLLYRIDLPNDGESLRLVKGCLTVLDAFFSDETVHCDTANFNAGRIWKCYGTTACKGDSTEARPHRKACIVSEPDESVVVPESVLRDLAGFIPCSLPDTEPGRRRGSFDLGRWLRSHGLNVLTERPWQGGTLYSLATCPFSSAHTDGAFAIQFGNGAVFAGCHHDSCGGGTQRWQELRAQFEPEWAAARKKNVQLEIPNGETKGQNEEKDTNGQPEMMNTNGETAVSSPALCAPPPSTEEMQEHRKRAMEILEHGDPLGFMLDVFHRDHVGDRTVAECLIMSVASQSVDNTSGLHVSISGNSGKGKTHACNAMVRLLPEEFRLKGTVSDKALFYYDDLRPGTVLLFDDVTLSDDMQEILKSATANFQEPIVHRTLTRERQLKVCTIPERCVWWLAKVEAIGDDQVMNRMLTVWIDDSTAQDKEVLLHLKESEAGDSSSVAEDPDVSVCRTIWEIIKGAVRRVKIPFAQRVCFSAIQNRRNPVMLFDLIKCHTLLHFLQRKTDEAGSLIATHEDFLYAKKLFGAIHGDVGGQGTKLTKNEAAALLSVAKMDIGVFTIYQLQDALGLSYYQTRRLLQGYTNNKGTYTGILDKCPAISLIDAMVAEQLCGMEIKRRVHYYSFDVSIYREWMVQSDVWLEPDDTDDDSDDAGHGGDDESADTGHGSADKSADAGQQGSDDDTGHEGDEGGEDDCTFAPRLHPDMAKSAKINNTQNDVCSGKEGTTIDRCTEGMLCLHRDSLSFRNPVSPMGGCGVLSDREMGANEFTKSQKSAPIADSGKNCANYSCTPGCKDKKTGAHVQTKKTTGTFPLPGILDHRNFRRSAVCLGTCSLCGDNAAVYHSDIERASVCEGCYARLVREWNKGEGVK